MPVTRSKAKRTAAGEASPFISIAAARPKRKGRDQKDVVSQISVDTDSGIESVKTNRKRVLQPQSARNSPIPGTSKQGRATKKAVQRAKKVRVHIQKVEEEDEDEEEEELKKNDLVHKEEIVKLVGLLGPKGDLFLKNQKLLNDGKLVLKNLKLAVDEAFRSASEVQDASPPKETPASVIENKPKRTKANCEKILSEPVRDINESLFDADKLERSAFKSAVEVQDASPPKETTASVIENKPKRKKANCEKILSEPVRDINEILFVADKLERSAFKSAAEVQDASPPKEAPASVIENKPKHTKENCEKILMEPVRDINEGLYVADKLESSAFKSASEVQDASPPKETPASVIENKPKYTKESCEKILNEPARDINETFTVDASLFVADKLESSAFKSASKVQDASPPKETPASVIENKLKYTKEYCEKILSEPVRDINESLFVAGKLESSKKKKRKTKVIKQNNNYEISHFEELDEQQKHRDGKEVPLWAKDGNFLEGQLFLCNPLLLEYAILSSRTKLPSLELFPKCDLRYKSFPNARVPTSTR